MKVVLMLNTELIKKLNPIKLMLPPMFTLVADQRAQNINKHCS
jgi:hypothetical protein